MNSDSSHQAAVAAVQSFRRSHHHGQASMQPEADHQVNATTTAPVVVAGNAAASAAKKFSSSPMGHIPHDMNKFYMSSLLNLNQTQTSKENASATNLQGNRS